VGGPGFRVSGGWGRGGNVKMGQGFKCVEMNKWI
jgi:hypothetical protein